MTLLIFLGVLSVLVLIHELGHYLAAVMFGIRVEEFAMGLPFTPPLIKWRMGETQYALYPLLFGGFVRLHGEESEVTMEKNRSFWDRGKKQRMLVVVAGVVMNMVLALVAFVALYVAVGVPIHVRDKVTIVKLNPGGPAENAGLKIKDRVVAVEDKPVTTGLEFSSIMKSWAGLPVNLTIERGETVALFEGVVEKTVQTQTVTLVPRVDPPAGEGPAGVAIIEYPYIQIANCQLKIANCLLDSVGAGVRATGTWIGRVVDGLRSIGKSLLKAQAPEGVSGPIGIYRLTGVVAGEGLWPLVELTAILSVNLAVFNVLPIPALDGGRMLFIWVEWVRRKRLTPELEQKVNQWGMVFLLGLILLVSLQDVLGLDSVKKLMGR